MNNDMQVKQDTERIVNIGLNLLDKSFLLINNSTILSNLIENHKKYNNEVNVFDLIAESLFSMMCINIMIIYDEGKRKQSINIYLLFNQINSMTCTLVNHP
jgi:hypothetical protein